MFDARKEKKENKYFNKSNNLGELMHWKIRFIILIKSNFELKEIFKWNDIR